jgi:hypothetical protein
MFCDYLSLPFPSFYLPVLLSFLEFLYFNWPSVPTIKNYVSSIRSRFQASSISLAPFHSPHLALALSSFEKNAPFLSVSKPIFSPSQLLCLLRAASTLPLAPLYSVAYSYAFFAMLRVSNLAPSSCSPFDPTRHLCRGDVFLHGDHVVIHIWWTKTLQGYNQKVCHSLHSIPSSILWPVRAFIVFR